MKHLPVRVTLLLLAVAAAAAATYFIIDLEKRGTAERGTQQIVRDQVRTLLATMAELKAGQRSYVAAGQGHQFWTARVTQVLQTVDPRIRELRGAIRSEAAESALDAAAVALDNFKKLDARAQEYVSLDQQLLASDLVFSDGLEMTGAATAQIDTALNEEIQASEQNLATLRRREAFIAAGGGAVLLLAALLLVPLAGRKPSAVENGLEAAPVLERRPDTSSDLFLAPPVDADPLPDLAGAARLCTEFGRVMETSEVPPLLARAAEILDAAGLVVWVSDRAGIELKPVLSYGYSEKVMAQMRGIPRDAQNAAALAFRSSQFRVVGSSDLINGAVVAPLVTPGGCVGVLAAELRHGGEQRESTQALATILAAQLATLVVAAPSAGTAAQAQA